jgi:hypothetical protein
MFPHLPVPIWQLWYLLPPLAYVIPVFFYQSFSPISPLIPWCSQIPMAIQNNSMEQNISWDAVFRNSLYYMVHKLSLHCWSDFSTGLHPGLVESFPNSYTYSYAFYICNFIQCSFTQFTECWGWNPRYHSKNTDEMILNSCKLTFQVNKINTHVSM